MEALGIIAIHLVKRTGDALLQVKQPEVGLFVPDGEVAIIGEGIDKVAPVL